MIIRRDMEWWFMIVDDVKCKFPRVVMSLR